VVIEYVSWSLRLVESFALMVRGVKFGKHRNGCTTWVKSISVLRR
jgi:hypothetical protein